MMGRYLKRLLVPAFAAVWAIGIASSNLIGQGGGNPPPLTVWDIDDPSNGKEYWAVVRLSPEGDAEVAQAAYVVKVTHSTDREEEYGSQAGTSTPNYDWSCTVSPPTTGIWPVGHARIRLMVGGEQEDSVTIKFKAIPDVE